MRRALHGVILLFALAAALPAEAQPAARAPAGVRRPLRRQVQVWPRLILERSGRRLGTFGFDGHVHTSHSRDADHPTLDVLELAEAAGLDAIVITDHGSSRAAQDLASYQGPLAVLIGEEVGGAFGHAVLWNVPDRRGVQAARGSIQGLAEHVHGRGGLVVLAHPAWWMPNHTYSPRRWMDPQALRRGGLAQGLDALELWNGVYHHRSRELVDAWAALLERGVFVPVVGSSDFHTNGAHPLGGPRTVFLCPVDAQGRPTEPLAGCLLESVRAGRLFVSDGPVVTLDVQGRTLGDTVEVRPGEPVRVEVRALAPAGGRLELFVGRRRAAALELAPGEERTRRWTIQAPAEDSFVRVEIQRSAPEEERPSFSLVTNPVMLDVAPRQVSWRGPDVGPLPPPEGYMRPGAIRRVGAAPARTWRPRRRTRRRILARRSAPSGRAQSPQPVRPDVSVQ